MENINSPLAVFKGSHVLIVDDIMENLQVLANMLIQQGMIVSTAMNADKALKFLSIRKPDLILLDVTMPGMDGYMLCEALKKNDRLREIPVIFLTARTQTEDIVRGFEAGSVDYVTKPFNKHELEARIGTHLKLKKYQDELKIKNKLLEDRDQHLLYLVDEKTRNIEQITIAMTIALESANFYNDEVTGNHIRRVSEYSGALAEEFGCDRDFIKRIRQYASLHDIGKIGIPGDILKKKGSFDVAEFEAMKRHVEIGGRILDNEHIDVMAKNIALYHHEYWNGKGYMAGLDLEQIPLEARIVAIVDVYDALVSERPYKKAWPINEVESTIQDKSGAQFQPHLVDAFCKIKHKFREIKETLK
jgi:putative two-component system response regulator